MQVYLRIIISFGKNYFKLEQIRKERAAHEIDFFLEMYVRNGGTAQKMFSSEKLSLVV